MVILSIFIRVVTFSRRQLSFCGRYPPTVNLRFPQRKMKKQLVAIKTEAKSAYDSIEYKGTRDKLEIPPSVCCFVALAGVSSTCERVFALRRMRGVHALA